MNALLAVLLPAHQRHKAHPLERGLGDARCRAADEREVLRGSSHRRDQPRSGRELLDEVRWRLGTGGGCYVDRLEGSLLREALPAVANLEMDVADPELPNRALTAVRARWMTLDRVDLSGKPSQQGRVVARAGADVA